MKRYVIFIANLKIGGAERVVSQLANNWCTYYDVEVYVFTLINDAVEFEIDSRVKIVSLIDDWECSKFEKLCRLFSALFLFRRHINNLSPKFVLSFMHKYNLFSLASLLGAGTPVIVSERDNPEERISSFICLLRRIFYRYARGVICQTKYAASYFSNVFFAEDFISIPNPIRRINRKENMEEKIILSVGRLTLKKGQKDLIDIAKNFKFKDWRFVFVGDGELRSTLCSYARELGVSNIEFVGATKDVDIWLSRASIFAFTSYWEGFPNALAEAMCAGLPVVSYDCPTGPSELILDGMNGYLVKLGDKSAFNERLETLVRDETKRQQFSERAGELATSLDSGEISKKYLEYCLSRSVN